ncbi:hypothetical protein PHLGIDRAFT_218704 [Phlebiopsis gigantea 11061_1 CR5-6]|uniref:Uncharacterized protein n=1 Tax=Phlebiopsis gigantea (strain 11061_1 CR5-6) TaxID=745531 RepID=A0A0C3S2L8_PHLG1|nr:hypothetical protein PHLGIDRAFT_218704 [Phlebiopsis gigantea 11061_1 CR5-6]
MESDDRLPPTTRLHCGPDRRRSPPTNDPTRPPFSMPQRRRRRWMLFPASASRRAYSRRDVSPLVGAPSARAKCPARNIMRETWCAGGGMQTAAIARCLFDARTTAGPPSTPHRIAKNVRWPSAVCHRAFCRAHRRPVAPPPVPTTPDENGSSLHMRPHARLHEVAVDETAQHGWPWLWAMPAVGRSCIGVEARRAGHDMHDRGLDRRTVRENGRGGAVRGGWRARRRRPPRRRGEAGMSARCDVGPRAERTGKDLRIQHIGCWV